MTLPTIIIQLNAIPKYVFFVSWFGICLEKPLLNIVWEGSQMMSGGKGIVEEEDLKHSQPEAGYQVQVNRTDGYGPCPATE